MSNPTINRWGLNLFWYRFWYTDKNSSFSFHQDNLIKQLILIYSHYGLLSFKNLFINKYWYFKYNINFTLVQNEYNLKYYRFVEYKNKIINETRISKLRKKLKNLYYSKIWILRYQNWLLINFYCFQPLITKKKKKNKKKRELDLYTISNTNIKFLIRRFKFFLHYFINNKIYHSFNFKL